MKGNTCGIYILNTSQDQNNAWMQNKCVTDVTLPDKKEYFVMKKFN